MGELCECVKAPSAQSKMLLHYRLAMYLQFERAIGQTLSAMHDRFHTTVAFDRLNSDLAFVPLFFA